MTAVRGVCLVVLVTLAAIAYAQDRTIVPPIDRGKGQVLIDTLQKESQTLQVDSASLKKQLATLISQVTDAQKAESDLSPLMDQVRASSSAIATLAEAVVDPQILQQIRVAQAKATSLLEQLLGRIHALDSAQGLWKTQIDTVDAQISVDDARIARNTDDVLVLQASMARTTLQASQMQALSDQLDAFEAQVEAALLKTQTLPSP